MMKEYYKRRLTVAILLGCIAVSCLIFWAVQPLFADGRPSNVLIICVDTLRSDHMSCYGYNRKTSPNVDEFARQSVLFENNRSQATCTFPSVNSLLTSRNIFDFLRNPNLVIPEHLPYLPRILQKAGYATAAVSASPIMRKTPSKHNPVGGFGGGFDIFEEQCEWRDASIVNQAIFGIFLNYLQQPESERKPFFLYAHYMEPHDPYRPPDRFDGPFSGAYEGKDFIKRGDPNPIAKMLFRNGPDVGLLPKDIGHLEDLYDDEIAWFDIQFKALIEFMKQHGVFDNTIIVFCSDHGEEFMEHGSIKHCHTVFDTECRTPLIIRFPGGQYRGKRKTVTGNIDIVPTLLDYLEIPTLEERFHGQSLMSIVRDDAPYQGFVYCAQGPERFVYDGRFKLIDDLKNERIRLFDIEKDRSEKHDLAPENPEVLNRLLQALVSWRAEYELDVSRKENLRISDEVEKRLRSVGYLR